jgi:hypothetical protein
LIVSLFFSELLEFKEKLYILTYLKITNRVVANTKKKIDGFDSSFENHRPAKDLKNDSEN